MADFHAQVLLMLILSVFISECRVVSPVSETVTATQQEHVDLPCLISNLTDYRIQWVKKTSDANQKVILARPKTSTIPDAERTKWEANQQGEMSLILTKLQKSDEGVYSCEICKGWDCSIVRNITLIVKQCKVLPAVKVATGTSANLYCQVNMTSRREGSQEISWERLKGGKPFPVHISETFVMNGASLAIQSARDSDSDWYRCKYMLGQIQRCFEIKLQVGNVVVTTTSPALTTSVVNLETRKDGNSGSIIAVILSAVVVGIATIAALIPLAIYCRRKKNQRAAQRTRWNFKGAEPDKIYENSLPNEDLQQQVNSLYQSQDGSLSSFHCHR